MTEGEATAEDAAVAEPEAAEEATEAATEAEATGDAAAEEDATEDEGSGRRGGGSTRSSWPTPSASARSPTAIPFRRMQNAYEGDTEAAARDDDAAVAEKVRQWELKQGLEPRDWVKWGREEEGRDQD